MSEENAGACLNAVVKYKDYLSHQCDAKAVDTNKNTSKKTRTWLYDEDDCDSFGPMFKEDDDDEAEEATGGGGAATGSTVVAFDSWLRNDSNYSKAYIKAIESDLDALEAFAEEDGGDGVVVKIVELTSPRTAADDGVSVLGAVEKLIERLKLANIVRHEKLQAIANREAERKRGEARRRQKERALADMSVPRALTKPLMLIGRKLPDNARAWQLQSLGSRRDVDSSFYDHTSYSRDFLPHVPEKMRHGAKVGTLGDVIFESYRSFMESLISPRVALDIAGHVPIPNSDTKNNAHNALAPPRDAALYRQWCYLCGVKARDQRVELALIEHYSFLAAIAYLEWNPVDEKLLKDLRAGVLKHASRYLYAAIERTLDSGGDGVEDRDTQAASARRVLRLLLVSPDDKTNMVRASFARETVVREDGRVYDNRPADRAWILQVTTKLFTPLLFYKSDAKEEVTPPVDRLRGVQPYLRLFEEKYVQVLDKAIRLGRLERSFSDDEDDEHEGNVDEDYDDDDDDEDTVEAQRHKSADAATRLSLPPRPDNVFTARVRGKAHHKSTFIALSPSHEVMQRRASYRGQQMLDTIDWARLYSQMAVLDGGVSPVLKLDGTESMLLARALMRLSEREYDGSDGDAATISSTLPVVNESPYFAALVHNARSSARDWRITDVLNIEKLGEGVSKVAHAIMAGIERPFHKVREGYSTTPHSLLSRARRIVNQTIIAPPFVVANELLSALSPRGAVNGKFEQLVNVGSGDDDDGENGGESRLRNAVILHDRGSDSENISKMINEVISEDNDDNGGSDKRTQRVHDHLLSHVLFDLAMRTPPGSAARALLALRYVQECRLHHAQAPSSYRNSDVAVVTTSDAAAAAAGKFALSAEEIMTAPDDVIVRDVVGRDPLARRAVELYRCTVTKCESNTTSFADVFGLTRKWRGRRRSLGEPPTDKSVDEAREKIRTCDIFESDFAAGGWVHTVMHVLVTALDILFVEMRAKLITEEYSARVAMLCITSDSASLNTMFRRYFLMMTSRTPAFGGQSDDLRSMIYLGVMLKHMNVRLSAFAISVAALCALCADGDDSHEAKTTAAVFPNAMNNIKREARQLEVEEARAATESLRKKEESMERLSEPIAPLASSSSSRNYLLGGAPRPHHREGESGSDEAALTHGDGGKMMTFWREDSFDPMSTHAYSHVFRDFDIRQCVESVAILSKFVQAAHVCSWDSTEGAHGANALSTLLRNYATEENVDVNIDTGRPAASKHAKRRLKPAEALTLSTCVKATRKAASFVHYFSRILWAAVCTSVCVRDNFAALSDTHTTHLVSQISGSSDLIALAAEMKPSAFFEKSEEDFGDRSDQTATAYSVLDECAVKCISQLAARYANADDPESAIQVNAARGDVVSFDSLVISALYLDYLACAWHDIDVASELTHLHACTDENDNKLFIRSRMSANSGAPLFASRVDTKHMMFIRILAETLKSKFSMSSFAWFVPPNICVQRVLGERDSPGYEQRKRELVVSCCLPTYSFMCSHSNKRHSLSIAAARNCLAWMLRFTSAPFTHQAEIRDVKLPARGSFYELDALPPPMSDDMRKQVQKYTLF